MQTEGSAGAHMNIILWTVMITRGCWYCYSMPMCTERTATSL